MYPGIVCACLDVHRGFQETEQSPTHHQPLHLCCGWDKSGSYRLTYLGDWSLGNGTTLQGLGGVALLE